MPSTARAPGRRHVVDPPGALKGIDMELSPFQFGLISNLMSLTVAGMGAAALFFFLSRQQVAPAYRPALQCPCRSTS